ncbi:TetR family transcriptional regulator [Actinosynnema sp. ALI-1.44]|uniref:TetR/AcrR family transcriptional regulator n=1 Tax=Actinosynnema sp. ALI-1.44 TaxID=1933779 RepID=UPI00097C9F18|nr:TetR/AcrR family transcriptional regulator [Actinosynnema sp. ALI-1.44]ONI75098.1 TetR family transcriptional regulator [Actinosynnema sp. ALI-1.44]
MPRLTRAESQARTRTRLLEVASELFLRDGYAATSLEKVADAAGYTRGAVYSNFRNKDELCMAVLDEIRAARVEDILAILRADTLDERVHLFEAWAERVVGDPGWTRLELEFGVQSSGDEKLREELATRIVALTELIAQGVRSFEDTDGIKLMMPADQIGVAMLSLGVGLGVFRSVEPKLPIGALVNTLRVLIGVPVVSP